MSGAPGAGKSTIAKAIAPQIGAVIIDHDVTKSALLNVDLPSATAGKASYFVLYALAENLLAQGFSVIFDSPCFYAELLQRGQQIAQAANAQYGYIECILPDLDVYDRRLRSRPRRQSQVTSINKSSTDIAAEQSVSETVFRNWVANMKRPKNNYLTLDTSLPLDTCVEQAIAYLATF